MKPRIMPLEELMIELAREHDSVCYEINKAETELVNFNYREGEVDFEKIVELLSQHTIDEQRSLLGYLIEKLGRDRSGSNIEVMRGHTQIMNLVKNLSTLIADGRGINIADLENLKTLLKEQFAKEQSLFWQASSLNDSKSREEYSSDLDRYVNEGGK